MEIKLFEHNEDGYQRLEEMLKNNKCATINHATGTGKSFIALKYIASHSDKKILYIAPTYEILNQIKENDAKKLGVDADFDTKIYRNLLKLDMKELAESYDCIILDEYHRVGANKTNVKVKELKEIIAESDDKKLIGLTATPIRYLDKERNMTDEIFDGNIASSISLQEALIDGILPTPTYITSFIKLEEMCNNISYSINRLSPSSTKSKLLQSLHEIKQQFQNELSLDKIFEKYIPENGKYIIFCKTIDEMQDVRSHVNTWFKSVPKINVFEVHSKLKKDEIREQIKEFDCAFDGLNLMLSVDLFNEGLHPKDVDGVIFNRKTKSPIIMFQQMGRAMSASHKGQVYIFDLKNNFSMHPVINNLYNQLVKLSEERKKEYPENKEEYENVVKKFKLIDETSEIINQLNQLKKEITYEAIVKSKIEFAIEKLKEYKRKNNIKNILSYYNLKGDILKNYRHLFKYADYITISQLSELHDIKVLLPIELMVSLDERASVLDGFESKHAKDVNDLKKDEEIILKIINKKILYENDYYFNKYINILTNSSKTFIEQLQKKVLNKKLQPWEKILLDLPVLETEVLENYKYVLSIYNSEIVPDYLVKSLSKSIKLNTIYNNQLEELLSMIKIKEEEKIDNNCLNENPKILFLLEYIEKSESLVDDVEFLMLCSSLNAREKKYINQIYNRKKQQRFNNFIDNFNSTMTLVEFISVGKLLNEDNINLFHRKVVDEMKKYRILTKVVSFVENSGQLPSINSANIDEREIALEYQQLIYNNLINDEELIKCIDEDASGLFENIMFQLQQTQLKEFFSRYFMFYNLNSRRPLTNAIDDEEEKMLAEEFERNKILLKKQTVKLLNNKLNTDQSIINTSRAYAKNKLASEKLIGKVKTL